MLAAGSEHPVEALERPHPRVRARREGVVEDHVRRRSLDQSRAKVALEERPDDRRSRRAPLPGPQDVVGAGAVQVGKPRRVPQREPQRSEIVLEADESQRPPRPFDRVATFQHGHGVVGRAETDVPHDQRLGPGLAQTVRQSGLVDVEGLRFGGRVEPGVHDLAGPLVDHAGVAVPGFPDLETLQGARIATAAPDGRRSRRVLVVAAHQHVPLLPVVRRERVGDDVATHGRRQGVVEAQVVLRQQLPAEHFPGLGQMVEVRP